MGSLLSVEAECSVPLKPPMKVGTGSTRSAIAKTMPSRADGVEAVPTVQERVHG